MDEKMLKQKMNTQLSGRTGENSTHMDTRLQQIYVEETMHIIGFNYVKNVNMDRKIPKFLKWSLSRIFRSLKFQYHVHSIQIVYPVHNLCVLTTLTALFNNEFLINFCICILQQIACGS